MYDVTPLQRFWRKVVVTEGCWHWTGAKSNGYGTMPIDGQTPKAYRFAYETFLGPIPPGAQIDHRCHNVDPDCTGGTTCLHRSCVNPAHLDAVDSATNLVRSPLTLNGIAARKTHCHKG